MHECKGISMEFSRVKLSLRRSLPLFLIERVEEVRPFGYLLPFRKVHSYSLLSLLNLFFLQEVVKAPQGRRRATR